MKNESKLRDRVRYHMYGWRGLTEPQKDYVLREIEVALDSDDESHLGAEAGNRTTSRRGNPTVIGDVSIHDRGIDDVKTGALGPMCGAPMHTTNETAPSPYGDFGEWFGNPYTKIILKSIERDYVPRSKEDSKWRN